MNPWCTYLEAGTNQLAKKSRFSSRRGREGKLQERAPHPPTLEGGRPRALLSHARGEGVAGGLGDAARLPFFIAYKYQAPRFVLKSAAGASLLSYIRVHPLDPRFIRTSRTVVFS